MTEQARSFVSLLGLKIDRSHPGAVSVSVDIEQRHRNSNGVVHGSVFHALLDTCMGLEAWHARGQQPVATAELSVRFLAAVSEGTMTARARVLKAGKRLIVCDGEIHHAGKLVAVAQGTFAAIQR
ncbi:MAG: PaaI family thioesterase [Polyangiaceae bacterium]